MRDRSGRKTGVAGAPQTSLAGPAISPDGARIAVSAATGMNVDIWIHEVARPVKTRLTTHAGADLRPIWSAGGDRIVFNSYRNGRSSLWVAPADGSAPETELFAGEAGTFLDSTHWTTRGLLVFGVRKGVYEASVSIWKPGDPRDTLVASPAPAGKVEADNQFSPDERFLLYTSNESGANEVYLRRFPEGTGKRQVSTQGGSQARWRRDGREIFYRSGRALMAAPVTLGSEPPWGPP